MADNQRRSPPSNGIVKMVDDSLSCVERGSKLFDQCRQMSFFSRCRDLVKERNDQAACLVDC